MKHLLAELLTAEWMKNPHDPVVDNRPAHPLFINVLPALAQARRARCPSNGVGGASPVITPEGCIAEVIERLATFIIGYRG